MNSDWRTEDVLIRIPLKGGICLQTCRQRLIHRDRELEDFEIGGSLGPNQPDFLRLRSMNPANPTAMTTTIATAK